MFESCQKRNTQENSSDFTQIYRNGYSSGFISAWAGIHIFITQTIVENGTVNFRKEMQLQLWRVIHKAKQEPVVLEYNLYKRLKFSSSLMAGLTVLNLDLAV